MGCTLPMGSRSGCAIFLTFSETLQHLAQWTEKGACIAFLPHDKLEKYLGLVQTYKSQTHISVSQLESLTGLLNFAGQVVAPGRPFLQRLYCLKEGLRKRLPWDMLRMSVGTLQDLATWEAFLHQYNGITMFGNNQTQTAQ